jgi:tetratricopeptide (TPR) repeat protein
MRAWRTLGIMSLYRFRRVLTLLVSGIVVCAPALFDGSRLVAAPQVDAGKASVQERLNRVKADLFDRAAKIDEDIRELKDILALDPRSPEAHLLLGIAYRTVGSADMMGEAVAELRQALTLNPDFVQARFYLAHLYRDLGQPSRAREELQAAVAQVPGNPQFLALLGETERQLGNPRRSVELNRQALQIDESFAQARYYVGLALFDLNQRGEAIEELERVVRSGPKAVEAYLALGTAYVEADRLDEAVATLQQGRKIDPSRPDIRIQLARAYRLKGLLDKADEQLTITLPQRTATAASPVGQQLESDLYLERGIVRLQQGRLEAAATAFKKVLDMDSNNGPATLGLAEVYLRQGLYAQASEYAARAEKLGFPMPEEKRRLIQQKLRRKAGRW